MIYAGMRDRSAVLSAPSSKHRFSQDRKFLLTIHVRIQPLVSHSWGVAQPRAKSSLLQQPFISPLLGSCSRPLPAPET